MRRHPFDALSFGFGVLFATAAAMLASDRFDVLDLGNTELWPVVVIALGLTLVVAAVTGARSERAALAATDAQADSHAREGGVTERSVSTDGPDAPSDAWSVPVARDAATEPGDESGAPDD
jgi:hypothetical protein